VTLPVHRGDGARACLRRFLVVSQRRGVLDLPCGRAKRGGAHFSLTALQGPHSVATACSFPGFGPLSPSLERALPAYRFECEAFHRPTRVRSSRAGSTSAWRVNSANANGLRWVAVREMRYLGGPQRDERHAKRTGTYPSSVVEARRERTYDPATLTWAWSQRENKGFTNPSQQARAAATQWGFSTTPHVYQSTGQRGLVRSKAS
jgi:hypothetical protein